jgi:hypothetical protein
MSQLNSPRLQGTVIFTALLIIILLSASRTTYTLSTARETAQIACVRPQQPPVCPLPSRQHGWPDGDPLDRVSPGGATAEALPPE